MNRIFRLFVVSVALTCSGLSVAAWLPQDQAGRAEKGTDKGRWVLRQTRYVSGSSPEDWCATDCWQEKPAPGRMTIRAAKDDYAAEYSFEYTIPPRELVPGEPIVMRLSATRLEYRGSHGSAGTIHVHINGFDDEPLLSRIDLGTVDVERPPAAATRNRTTRGLVPSPTDHDGAYKCKAGGFALAIRMGMGIPGHDLSYYYVYDYVPPGAAVPQANPDAIRGTWKRDSNGVVYEITGANGRYEARIADRGKDPGMSRKVGELVWKVQWNAATGTYDYQRVTRMPSGADAWIAGVLSLDAANTMSDASGARLSRVKGVSVTPPPAGPNPDDIIGTWVRQRTGRVYRVEGGNGTYRATIVTLGAEAEGHTVGELIWQIQWNPTSRIYESKHRSATVNGRFEWRPGTLRLADKNTLVDADGERITRR